MAFKRKRRRKFTRAGGPDHAGARGEGPGTPIRARGEGAGRPRRAGVRASRSGSWSAFPADPFFLGRAGAARHAFAS